MNRSAKISLSISVLVCSACAGPLALTDNSREGFFRNGSIELHYVVDLPDGPPPFPGVVMGHGSGPKEIRDLEAFARRWRDTGYAVLRYDKRGTGESGGFHTPSNTGEVNRAIREDYAPDLVAGFQFLSTQSDIDQSRIGLFGESQAGWTIAVASALVEEAFVVVLSGPTLPLADVGAFEAAAHRESNRHPDDVWNGLVASGALGHGGIDPQPHLMELSAPGLWIFGARDRNVPVLGSMEFLEELRDSKGKDIEIVLFPDGDHGLREFDTRDPIDYWPFVVEFLNSLPRSD